tara:strand:- start:438 stop:668 length:231 start_codon:yes stop_codon:yes gene_type:complete
MRTSSQSAMILNFLENGGSLTPIEALEKFKCFRLAARINDLREAGHNINTEIFKDDNGKSYAVYSLAKIQKQGELF